jgi:hypothetical protein
MSWRGGRGKPITNSLEIPEGIPISFHEIPLFPVIL